MWAVMLKAAEKAVQLMQGLLWAVADAVAFAIGADAVAFAVGAADDVVVDGVAADSTCDSDAAVEVLLQYTMML